MELLLAWSKKRGIHLIVDESFLDFACDGEQITLLDNRTLANNPHLVIVKSISKSYGVPGLRLGMIACSDADLVNNVRKDVAIWNINSFAEFYLQIYGKYEKDYKKACQAFMSEREHFFQSLQAVDYLRVIPSAANYFLCEVTGCLSSHELTDRLLEHDILIKDCGAKQAFQGRNYVRIAVKGRADNERLMEALKRIIER